MARFINTEGGNMQAIDNVCVSQDILGPRFSFTWHDGDDERGTYELYAGEWSDVFESMGDDCCWHERRRPLKSVGPVLDMALGQSHPFSVEQVAAAQLQWASLFGGRKGAAMRRSLDVQLAKHGLRLG